MQMNTVEQVLSFCNRDLFALLRICVISILFLKCFHMDIQLLMYLCMILILTNKLLLDTVVGSRCCLLYLICVFKLYRAWSSLQYLQLCNCVYRIFVFIKHRESKKINKINTRRGYDISILSMN